jgi:hypothetical protein
VNNPSKPGNDIDTNLVSKKIAQNTVKSK